VIGCLAAREQRDRKRMLASAVPRSGASVTYATRIQSLSALKRDDLAVRERATWVLP